MPPILLTESQGCRPKAIEVLGWVSATRFVLLVPNTGVMRAYDTFGLASIL